MECDRSSVWCHCLSSSTELCSVASEEGADNRQVSPARSCRQSWLLYSHSSLEKDHCPLMQPASGSLHLLCKPRNCSTW
ncbi:hypothetical protein EK904_005688 [Melospiza melodia maxima]|nr:hypothetical protein EK904_005688 [Melospiza melodia maxima]